MMGMRGSFFKSVIINPLVWAGCVLTGFTLHYEGYDKAFEIFFKPETYRNLAIGAVAYVALFDRRYKKGGEKLDFSETLAAVIEAMSIILLVWVVLLMWFIGYHESGLRYSNKLRERYRENGWMTNDNAAKAATAAKNEASEFLDGEIELQKGQRYKLIPQEDGSIVVEVLE